MHLWRHHFRKLGVTRSRITDRLLQSSKRRPSFLKPGRLRRRNRSRRNGMCETGQWMKRRQGTTSRYQSPKAAGTFYRYLWDLVRKNMFPKLETLLKAKRLLLL